MFADWLSAELVQRGMSQADLEDKSGLSAATISRILNGSRGAGRETSEKIDLALNVPEDQAQDNRGGINAGDCAN